MREGIDLKQTSSASNAVIYNSILDTYFGAKYFIVVNYNDGRFERISLKF